MNLDQLAENPIKENFSVALIPARSGSKRIPNKNLIKLRGKPLIAYAVDLCNSCSFIQQGYISTNSRDIAKLAKKNVVAPFLRPEQFSGDSSKDIDVVKHFLAWFSGAYTFLPNLIVYLRPTAPVRSANLVKKIIDKAYYLKSSVRCVSKIDPKHSPEWCIVKEVESFKSYLSDGHKIRSQEIREYYFPNGLIDVFHIDTLIKKNDLYGETFGALEVPISLAHDIDNFEDLEFLENNWLNINKNMGQLF